MTKSKEKQQVQDKIESSELPSVQEIRGWIPKELFIKDEWRFMIHVFYSLSLVLATAYLAFTFIPLEWKYLPIWAGYAVVNGTFATGLWVLGHECGHKAFSDSDLKNDVLGYILHTALLVPYFSWQHSHHVHHSKCNHTDLGESHVPVKEGTAKAKSYQQFKELIGDDAFAILQMNLIAWVGWPLYLLIGVTGAPDRGFTSHFIVPNELFPKDKLVKVGISNVGLIAMFGVLYAWVQATSFALVAGLYFAPYLIVNCWLTIYTFLQHTDKNVPHYDKTSWTWLKGALCTIDRAYPGYINTLHFDIGSTHVVHHLFHEMPHYNAMIATYFVKDKLGKHYFYDGRPIWKAFYEAAKLVYVRHVGNGEWRF